MYKPIFPNLLEKLVRNTLKSGFTERRIIKHQAVAVKIALVFRIDFSP